MCDSKALRRLSGRKLVEHSNELRLSGATHRAVDRAANATFCHVVCTLPCSVMDDSAVVLPPKPTSNPSPLFIRIHIHHPTTTQRTTPPATATMASHTLNHGELGSQEHLIAEQPHTFGSQVKAPPELLHEVCKPLDRKTTRTTRTRRAQEPEKHSHTRTHTHTHIHTRTQTHKIIHTNTHIHTHSLTHSLTHLRTHSRNHSRTHPPTHP